MGNEPTKEQLQEAVKHLDAVCTILGMNFKMLLNAEDKEETVGFVVGYPEMFEGEVEAIEEDVIWSPAAKPSDPKQLN